MRNTDAYLGSIIWIAIATLMPLAALEPATSRAAPTGEVVSCDAAACASPRS